jgi:hypothetical protein
MKCSGCRANALNMHRYFVDWLKEFLKLAKLILVVFCKEVIFIDSRLGIALVERKGVLQPNSSFNHEVSTILSNTSVSNEPQDLLSLTGHYSLTLLSLEQDNPRVVSLNVSDEIMELPYRNMPLMSAVLCFLRAAP